MKKLIAIMIVALCATSAQATVYNDSTGDTFFGGILDIVSVEVTDNGTDVSFKMSIVGDIQATNWGNYMYHIDTDNSVGDTDNISNPWNRPISYSPDGADYWLGSWMDGGGTYQHWTYAGGNSWNMNYQAATDTYNANDFRITITLASIGLVGGDTFCFDAYASGAGGDPGAIDSLGNPNQQVGDWNVQSNANPVCYTTTPEPTTLGLLSLGGLILIRRRR